MWVVRVQFIRATAVKGRIIAIVQDRLGLPDCLDMAVDHPAGLGGQLNPVLRVELVMRRGQLVQRAVHNRLVVALQRREVVVDLVNGVSRVVAHRIEATGQPYRRLDLSRNHVPYRLVIRGDVFDRFVAPECVVSHAAFPLWMSTT
ncbi:Uncharacterised protein [Mycobacteroides abscessus subsp. massiliense]|nr:Uncharacterised protein [Mycobacteroides abscessus subsp. massiliense]